MNEEAHVLRVLGLLLEEARQLILRDGPHGLRPSQYRVIGSVPPDGAITVTELAERVGMTKQGIGQFVAQLCEDGYLVTESDPADRRVRLVARTRLGHEATAGLQTLMQRLEATWAERVGPRRYQQFRTALDAIAFVE